MICDIDNLDLCWDYWDQTSMDVKKNLSNMERYSVKYFSESTPQQPKNCRRMQEGQKSA